MAVEVLVREAVQNELESSLASEKIAQTAKKLLSALGSEDKELSILVTEDEEIASLNECHRGKSNPTDVLSFSMVEGDGLHGNLHGNLLGDVVISLPTAKKQAAELGVSLAEEFLRLLIHGTLHLHGYEHEDVEEHLAQEMQQTEEKLYDELVEDFC